MLERVDLSHARKMKVGELSGGMKQRLSFVTAMIGSPSILLLDEPTASIDQRSQRTLITWLYELREAGMTMVFSTHQYDEIISLADRSITLEGGNIISQTEVSDNGEIIIESHIRVGDK
jgi:ABC-type multidrug transport system ATPase subunit